MIHAHGLGKKTDNSISNLTSNRINFDDKKLTHNDKPFLKQD